MSDYYAAPPLPQAFIWRKAHSLTGLWFALYLMEHLFVNSQAALLFGDSGNGFVRAVNAIQEIPYLLFIEIFLLGVPLLFHAIWGIKYLLTSKSIYSASDGTSPSFNYPRNKAYTWQRITSWILLVGVLAHVIHMRILEYPTAVKVGNEQYYVIKINPDQGLDTLSKRLGFEVYHADNIKNFLNHSNNPEAYESYSLKAGQLAAVAPSFGLAELLMVRDAFKNPLMILLYTGLVLTACFHAFNGLWTFMIRWGVTLTARSQQLMRKVAVFLMLLVSFLGLVAIWGTYWINLKN